MSFSSTTGDLAFACYTLDRAANIRRQHGVETDLYVLTQRGQSPKNVRSVTAPLVASISSRELLGVVTDHQSFVHVEECNTRRRVATFRPSSLLLDALYAFGPNHQMMAVTGIKTSREDPQSGRHVVALLKVGDRTPTFVFSGLAKVTALSYSFDGRHIAAADERGIVRVWNTHTGRQILEIDEAGVRDEEALLVRQVKFLEGADVLITAGRRDIRFWNLRDGTEVARLHEPEAISGTYFVEPSSDGAMVVTSWHKRDQNQDLRSIVKLWRI